MRLAPVRAGLVVGAFLGLWHAGWSAFVAGGIAKALIDFILRLHFLHLSVDVMPFNLATAVTLVAITSAVGFVIGLVFALVWNAVLPRTT